MNYSKSHKTDFKRIFYPNPISNKSTSLKIKRSLIENASKFPVAITTKYEDASLTLFIDANYSVRGVEKSIFLESPDDRIDQKHDKSLLENAERDSDFGKDLVLGLSKAGKTSVIKRLSQHYFDSNIQPTLGTNIMKAVLENTSFLFYDMGGQIHLRSKWTTTVPHPEAIVFVLDTSSETESLDEARREFDRIVSHYYLEENSLRNLPLLILGNKIDLFAKQRIHKDSLIRAVFNVLQPDRFKDINYHVGLVSALTGEGIVFNFKWLISEKIHQSG